MANENKTAKEYVQKGYLIAHLANCGIRTINYDEWERLCECIHEAKPADVGEVVRCKDCKYWNAHVTLSTFLPNAHYCGVIDSVFDGEFFCSYGERREHGKIH